MVDRSYSHKTPHLLSPDTCLACLHKGIGHAAGRGSKQWRKPNDQTPGVARGQRIQQLREGGAYPCQVSKNAGCLREVKLTQKGGPTRKQPS